MTLRDRSNAAGQCLNLPTLATSLSSGKTASVPVWWYFIHVTSKGITSATVAPLPCQPDLRQLRLEVLHTRIKDQALAQELRDFVEEYYAPSRASLKFRAGKLSTRLVTTIPTARFHHIATGCIAHHAMPG